MVDDRRQIQCQATFLRFLSVAESFSGDTLIRHAEQAVKPNSHAIIGKIWDRAAVGAVSGWNDQESHYRNWLGVVDKAMWKPMHQLAQARNAIAHGLGTLTRQQQGNRNAVEAALRATQIPVVGNRVELSDEVIAHAANLCRDFILKLDLAVSTRQLLLQSADNRA